MHEEDSYQKSRWSAYVIGKAPMIEDEDFYVSKSSDEIDAKQRGRRFDSAQELGQVKYHQRVDRFASIVSGHIAKWRACSVRKAAVTQMAAAQMCAHCFTRLF